MKNITVLATLVSPQIDHRPSFATSETIKRLFDEQSRPHDELSYAQNTRGIAIEPLTDGKSVAYWFHIPDETNPTQRLAPSRDETKRADIVRRARHFGPNRPDIAAFFQTYSGDSIHQGAALTAHNMGDMAGYYPVCHLLFELDIPSQAFSRILGALIATPDTKSGEPFKPVPDFIESLHAHLIADPELTANLYPVFISLALLARAAMTIPENQRPSMKALLDKAVEMNTCDSNEDSDPDTQRPSLRLVIDHDNTPPSSR